MVSISEARASLEQQKKALQERKQSIEASSIPPLSRAELQRRGQSNIVERNLARQRHQSRRVAELERLRPFEGQLQTAEAQIQTAESQERKRRETIQAFRDAQKGLEDPRFIIGFSGQAEKFFKLMQRSESRARTELSNQILELGGKPVLQDGKIVGAEIFNMSVPLSALEKGISIPSQDFTSQEIVVPPPSSIDLPTSRERLSGFFRKRGLQDPLSAIFGGSMIQRQGVQPKTSLVEVASRVFDVPEIATKEKDVQFINLPSTRGGTQQTRPVNFLDIDTKVLPPEQNLKLTQQRIVTEFSTGKLSEEQAIKQFDVAQKKFVLDKTKREIPATILGGVGFGLVSAVASPITTTIAIAGGISVVKNRGQFFAFAKENPQATVIGLGYTILGVVAGGKIGTKLIKPKVPADPTIKFGSVDKTSAVMRLGTSVEQDFAILIQQKRISGVKFFEVSIPTLKKGVKIKLRVLEFQKDGLQRFVGQEIKSSSRKFGRGIKEKTIGEFQGRIISSSGKGGLSDVITRVIRRNTKLNQVQISEFLERVRVVDSKVIKGRTPFDTKLIILTENEAKLTKQFDLKGLSPQQTRSLFRTRLFGVKEANRLKGRPFSELEFKLATQLSVTDVISTTKLLSLEAQKTMKKTPAGSVMDLGLAVTTKTIGLGKSSVNVLGLKPTIKTKVKITPEGRVKPTGKIPSLLTDTPKVKLQGFDSFGFKISSKKLPVSAQEVLQKPKTPLSKTFAEEKVTSPSSTLVSLGKQLQKDIVKKQIKTGETKQTFASSLIGIPRAVGGEGLTPTQIREAQGTVILESELLGIEPPRNLPVTLVSTRNINNQLIAPLPQTALFQPNRLRTLTKELIETQNVNKISQVSSRLLNQGLRNKQTLIQSLKFIQQEKLKLRQKQKTSQTQKQQQKQKQKTRLVLPPFPPSLEQTPTAQKLLSLRRKGTGVDVIVGQKTNRQRTIAKNVHPFTGAKLGAEFIDDSIDASYKLKSSGKKAVGKKTKPFNINPRFRPSKRDPLFIVEKRKHRLSSSRERREIAQARKRVSNKSSPLTNKRILKQRKRATLILNVSKPRSKRRKKK